MSKIETSQIQNSFKKLTPILDETMSAVLSRLVQEHPEMSEFLPCNEQEAIRTELGNALIYIVSHIENIESIQKFLKTSKPRLGQFGSKREHYLWSTKAMLNGLKRALGEEWNSELQTQWGWVLQLICKELHMSQELKETENVTEEAPVETPATEPSADTEEATTDDIAELTAALADQLPKEGYGYLPQEDDTEAESASESKAAPSEDPAKESVDDFEKELEAQAAQANSEADTDPVEDLEALESEIANHDGEEMRFEEESNVTELPLPDPIPLHANVETPSGSIHDQIESSIRAVLEERVAEFVSDPALQDLIAAKVKAMISEEVQKQIASLKSKRGAA